MSETRQVLCDGCERDLTYTGNSVDYRLVLSNEGKTPWYVREGMRGGMVTDMMIYPPIDSTKHFCGLKCLRDWLAKGEEGK